MAALSVEPIGDDVFGVTGESMIDRPTFYGGALLAQALQAAAVTAPAGFEPHHLHAEFTRAGRAGSPVEFAVERVKDGRTFSSRRVVGRQGGRVILTEDVSFHSTAEPGPEYQTAAPMRFPADRVESGELTVRRDSAGLETINIPRDASAPDDAEQFAWYRAQASLPTDAAWPATILAYASDMAIPAVAINAVGLQAGGPDSNEPGVVATTSLNHTMWFHRPARCDEWFLMAASALSTAYDRGLALGSAYDFDGRKVASIVQEIFVKSPSPPVG
jgi:acyl-CoA thioesterase-2